MLHTKYQGSRPFVLDKNIFSCFTIYKKAYVQHVTAGRAIFWLQGHNLFKLGRGLLGDATYQNVKALGLMVLGKKIFSCFSVYKAM